MTTKVSDIRKNKARDMLREHGWQLLSGLRWDDNYCSLEFWGKAGRVCIMQFWDDGGSSCYFSDGNPTWEEWGKML